MSVPSVAFIDGVPVHTRIQSYVVNAAPDGHPQAHHWEIRVESTGDDRWAVRLGSWRMCLSTDGGWANEPSPSSRNDTWLARHRFDLDTALELARREAPKVEVNGTAAADLGR